MQVQIKLEFSSLKAFWQGPTFISLKLLIRFTYTKKKKNRVGLTGTKNGETVKQMNLSKKVAEGY